MNKRNTIKRKVAKVKSQTKTHIHNPNNFVTLSLGLTNLTPRKRKLSRGNYSSKTIIQELEALECFNLEKLLQGVQTQEDVLQDLPSIEGALAEVERLTEQMERELEVYLNEP